MPPAAPLMLTPANRRNPRLGGVWASTGLVAANKVVTPNNKYDFKLFNMVL
jgi:hypothetical protein